MSVQFHCRCGTLLTAQRDAQVSSICCPSCLEMVPIPEVAAQQPAFPLDQPDFPPPNARQSPAGPPHQSGASDATAIPFGNSFGKTPPSLTTRARRGKVTEATKLPSLVAALAVASLVQLAPVFGFGEPSAPDWMRCLLVISLLQLMFWAWMILVPDWSSLWVATLASASTAVFYGFVLAIAIAAPADAPDLLDMNAMRASAQLWAVVMLIMCGALTLACGQLSFQWQKRSRVGH